jgi:hypothetical protein
MELMNVLAMLLSVHTNKQIVNKQVVTLSRFAVMDVATLMELLGDLTVSVNDRIKCKYEYIVYL